MGRCLRRIFKAPYKDFMDNANTDSTLYFAESPKYFYSADGMKRLKKTNTMVDSARRRVLRDDDKEERDYWTEQWGLA